jgi:hypothetical protein
VQAVFRLEKHTSAFLPKKEVIEVAAAGFAAAGALLAVLVRLLAAAGFFGDVGARPMLGREREKAQMVKQPRWGNRSKT